MAFIRLVTVFVFLLLSTFVFDVQAQTKKLYKGQTHRGNSKRMISLKDITKNELITVYFAGGLATYNGDLSGNITTHSYRPQLGGGAMLRTGYLGKRLNLRVEARCFRLYSNDVYKTRNLNFRSTNWEFLALGQIDLFPYEKMMRRRTKINPYAYGGIGVMTYDPWGQLNNGKWAQLRPLETEHVKYGNVAFVYTGGLGFKFNFSYRWNFMAEGGYRFTTTDYIDDVSGPNYSPGNSFSNPISASMSNKSNKPNPTTVATGRGNPKHKDGYAIISVGMSYTFSQHHSKKTIRATQLLHK
jgi:hypothetical protein